MPKVEQAGKGRFRRWNDSRNRETAARLSRMVKDRLRKTRRKPRAVVDSPTTRIGEACFYGSSANPHGVVVDSNIGATSSPSIDVDFPELKIRQTLDTLGVKIDRADYRHRNGHMVTRWILVSPVQYEALRSWWRRRQARKRAFAANPVTASRTTHREFDRKPILSTQLEPGVTVKCNSYSQFEREVERRGKVLGDIR